jgi:hypothetical protein
VRHSIPHLDVYVQGRGYAIIAQLAAHGIRKLHATEYAIDGGGFESHVVECREPKVPLDSRRNLLRVHIFSSMACLDPASDVRRNDLAITA